MAAPATTKSAERDYGVKVEAKFQVGEYQIVTEYAWATGSCDPCPTPPLDSGELMTLGADVMPGLGGYPDPGQFVLTRLHARYGAESLGEDLVFRAGEPITGGRETGGPGHNEVGATIAE